MGVLDNIRARIKRDTKPYYTPRAQKLSTALFGKTEKPGKFSNESTMEDIYTAEPFIRGAVDTIVSAVNGDFSLETVTLEPATSELKFIENTRIDFTLPEVNQFVKGETAVLQLLLNDVCYAEVSRGDMNFYLLEAEDCTPIWNGTGQFIEELIWRKDTAEERTLDRSEFAMISRHDPDSKFFKNPVLESLVDVANLLYFARKYNIEIFQNGGLPYLLFLLSDQVSDSDFDDFVAEIKKPGRHIVSRLPDGVQIHPLAGFNKDMEYDQLTNYAIQSIMTALRVTPDMMSLGTLKGGTAGNSGSEKSAFADSVHGLQKTMNVFFTDIIHKLYSSEVLTDDPMAHRFRPFIRGNGVSGRPKRDYAKAMRFRYKPYMDMRQLAATLKILLSSNMITPNEGRDMWGLEPRPEPEFDMPIGSNQSQAPGNTGEEKPEGQPGRDDPENDTPTRGNGEEGEEGRQSQTQEVEEE